MRPLQNRFPMEERELIWVYKDVPSSNIGQSASILYAVNNDLWVAITDMLLGIETYPTSRIILTLEESAVEILSIIRHRNHYPWTYLLVRMISDDRPLADLAVGFAPCLALKGSCCWADTTTSFEPISPAILEPSVILFTVSPYSVASLFSTRYLYCCLVFESRFLNKIGINYSLSHFSYDTPW